MSMSKKAMLRFRIDMGYETVLVSTIANDEGCTKAEAKDRAVDYLAKGLTKSEAYELYRECLTEHLRW